MHHFIPFKFIVPRKSAEILDQQLMWNIDVQDIPVCTIK